MTSEVMSQLGSGSCQVINSKLGPGLKARSFGRQAGF